MQKFYFSFLSIIKSCILLSYFYQLSIIIYILLQIFRNSYQRGFLSILYAVGEKPLKNWEIVNENNSGRIQRQIDKEIKGNTVEIISSNSSTTWISCPPQKKDTLGIKLPYLVLLVKNLNKFFSFEVEVLDDKNFIRRFKASNFTKKTSIKQFVCSMPLQLGQDWNQIQFNLADFTQRAYKTNFVECTRITIHASCRIRRVYFCDNIYEDDELPEEYKMIPTEKKTEYGSINGVKGTFRMRVSKNPTDTTIKESDLFDYQQTNEYPQQEQDNTYQQKQNQTITQQNDNQQQNLQISNSDQQYLDQNNIEQNKNTYSQDLLNSSDEIENIVKQLQTQNNNQQNQTLQQDMIQSISTQVEDNQQQIQQLDNLYQPQEEVQQEIQQPVEEQHEIQIEQEKQDENIQQQEINEEQQEQNLVKDNQQLDQIQLQELHQQQREQHEQFEQQSIPQNQKDIQIQESEEQLEQINQLNDIELDLDKQQ